MKKVLFIHIPKTGGISVKSFLRSKGFDDPYKRTWIHGHDPFYVLKKNNIISDDTFTFSVVRNPYRRMYSYYRFLSIVDKVIDLKCFERFLDYIEYGDPYVKPSVEKSIYKHSQNFFISENGNICVDKIYKIENIQELEKDFDVKLPKTNVGAYSKEDYIKDYTKDNIERVNKLFKKDFELFGYEENEQGFIHSYT